MTSPPGGRISRRERITRKPGRAEWKQLAAWLTELWPHDEYTAIVAQAWRLDQPPPDWR
jgi:hypothetical protein